VFGTGTWVFIAKWLKYLLLCTLFSTPANSFSLTRGFSTQAYIYTNTPASLPAFMHKTNVSMPIAPTILYPFRSMPHVFPSISTNATNSNHKPLRFTIAEYIYVLEGNIKFSCEICSTRGTDVFLWFVNKFLPSISYKTQIYDLHRMQCVCHIPAIILASIIRTSIALYVPLALTPKQILKIPLCPQ